MTRLTDAEVAGRVELVAVVGAAAHEAVEAIVADDVSGRAGARHHRTRRHVPLEADVCELSGVLGQNHALVDVCNQTCTR